MILGLNISKYFLGTLLAFVIILSISATESIANCGSGCGRRLEEQNKKTDADLQKFKNDVKSWLKEVIKTLNENADENDKINTETARQGSVDNASLGEAFSKLTQTKDKQERQREIDRTKVDAINGSGWMTSMEQCRIRYRKALKPVSRDNVLGQEALNALSQIKMFDDGEGIDAETPIQKQILVEQNLQDVDALLISKLIKSTNLNKEDYDRCMALPMQVRVKQPQNTGYFIPENMINAVGARAESNALKKIILINTALVHSFCEDRAGHLNTNVGMKKMAMGMKNSNPEIFGGDEITGPIEMGNMSKKAMNSIISSHPYLGKYDGSNEKNANEEEIKQTEIAAIKLYLDFQKNHKKEAVEFAKSLNAISEASSKLGGV
jgi:hypothetical protein